MVPLYFVNQQWEGYRLVRIGLSGLPLKMHYDLGRCIFNAAEALGRQTVLIASGDLSHRLKAEGPYGYRKEGTKYDQQVMDIMGRAAFAELLDFPEDFCSQAGECGHRSFVMMAGALSQLQITPEKLSYEGPFGVGYGICAYSL
jgi:AmmeMemoRadiSam system protein B